MTFTTMTPTFACFAGSGSADLRFLIGGIIAIVIALGLTALANLYFITTLTKPGRLPIPDLLVFGAYAIAGGLIFTGRTFEHTPELTPIFIISVLCGIPIHFLTLFSRFRKNRALRANSREPVNSKAPTGRNMIARGKATSRSDAPG